jgi:hypothetical protein
MSNDYDDACRRLFKDQPDGLLAWLLTDFTRLARRRGYVDTRRLPFPGKPEQTGDVVVELEALAPVQELWALAVEFQINPDPLMFGRLLIFLGGLWLECRPDEHPGSRYRLAASVINLTGTTESIPATQEFAWPGPDGLLCCLRVRERHLAMESAADTLEKIAGGVYHRCLLPWIPLMQGGGEPALIDRWKSVAETEPDPRRRGNYGNDALVFAEKSADPDAWKRALEDWNVDIRSPYLEQIRQEGRGQERAEALLDLLTLRGMTVPDDLARKIRACSDMDQLRTWFALANRADSLDAFRQQASL